MLRFSVTVTLLLASCAGSSCFGQQRPPNLVLIMADDLGREALGCLGGTDYETPRLDALARAGIRFTQCHANPVCTPSRVKIMTGRYGHRNYRGFGRLDPTEKTFANRLRDAGYATCIAGKWQLSGNAKTVRDFGFDAHCLWNMHAYRKGARALEDPPQWRRRYDDPRLYVNGEWKTPGKDAYGPDVCTEFLKQFMTAKRDGPFLVYYPMILPHDPFVAPPTAKGPPGPKNGKKNFAAMVRHVDLIVGRLVDHLHALGLEKNTLVLFTGDNGTHSRITSMTTGGPVRGGKSYPTHHGTHVPLIASWPGRVRAGTVWSRVVDFSDFHPTLLDAAGVTPDPERVVDGKSFLPQILGKKPEAPREWTFCHYWHRGRDRERLVEFVRDERWKLYAQGSLHDLMADPLERTALPAETRDPEARKARVRLSRALASVTGR